jgi:hypothetical protein
MRSTLFDDLPGVNPCHLAAFHRLEIVSEIAARTAFP